MQFYRVWFFLSLFCKEKAVRSCVSWFSARTAVPYLLHTQTKLDRSEALQLSLETGHNFLLI